MATPVSARMPLGKITITAKASKLDPFDLFGALYKHATWSVSNDYADEERAYYAKADPFSFWSCFQDSDCMMFWVATDKDGESTHVFLPEELDEVLEPNRREEQTRAALEAVLDYLADDEGQDFEAAGEPENHIFRHLLTLRRWLDSQAVG